MKIYKNICLHALLVASLALAACDDGHVDDPGSTDFDSGITVQLVGGKGLFKQLSAYPAGENTVAVACFAEGSDYSVIQTYIPGGTTDTSTDTVVLRNVPASATSVEIAVVNVLRQRVKTLCSYSMDGLEAGDSLKINMGSLFDVVNSQLFQRADCSRCHASQNGAAGLDLTSEHAYASLVNVRAHKNPEKYRVLPNSAADSYLYKVLSEGDEHVSYQHPSLMADHQDALDVLEYWINLGAKE